MSSRPSMGGTPNPTAKEFPVNAKGEALVAADYAQGTFKKNKKGVWYKVKRVIRLNGQVAYQWTCLAAEGDPMGAEAHRKEAAARHAAKARREALATPKKKVAAKPKTKTSTKPKKAKTPKTSTKPKKAKKASTGSKTKKAPGSKTKKAGGSKAKKASK